MELSGLRFSIFKMATATSIACIFLSDNVFQKLQIFKTKKNAQLLKLIVVNFTLLSDIDNRKATSESGAAYIIN